MPLIRCHDPRVKVFAQFIGLTFPICLMILHMPIPIIFFSGFPTWCFHNHFVELGTWHGDSLGGTLFVLVHLRIFCLIVATPHLCFPFFNKWYTYIRSCIRCGFCVFTIARGVINIKAFSATNKCVAWFPQGLDHFISLPFGFLTLDSSFIFWVH